MTRQSEMKGLGHAILTGEPLIGSEPFGVILADDLCLNNGDGVMAQMVRLFRQFRCSIVAVQEVPEDQIEKYGVIGGEALKEGLYSVDRLVENNTASDAPSIPAILRHAIPIG